MNAQKAPTTVRQLAISMFSYSSASIFGPLLFFGSIGFFLDKYFDKKPLFIIISIFIAFISTNILIYKKIKKLIKKFENITPPAKAEKEKKNLQNI